MDKYIPIEQMSNEDIQAWIDRSFARWEDLRQNGCNDPGFSDGANMNLVRNHIIHYYSVLDERQAEETQISLFDAPDILRRPVPQEVSDSFMTQPEKLMDGAKRTLDMMLAHPDYAYLQSLGDMLPAKVRKTSSFDSFMHYPDSLKYYIEHEEYPRLRSFQNTDYWDKAIHNFREKIDEEIYRHARRKRDMAR